MRNKKVERCTVAVCQKLMLRHTRLNEHLCIVNVGYLLQYSSREECGCGSGTTCHTLTLTADKTELCVGSTVNISLAAQNANKLQWQSSTDGTNYTAMTVTSGAG